LTHNGEPYVPAEVKKCHDCEWEALVDKVAERKKTDGDKHRGTNGTNGTNGTGGTHGMVSSGGE